MAITKTELLKLVQSLPENVTVEQVVEELYACSNIEAGLRELDAGRGIPHDEVKEKVKQWLPDLVADCGS